MKKTLFLSLLLLVCCTLKLSAQETSKYKSENYYGNGVTEYLHLVTPQNSKNWSGLEVYYFTSKKPTKIKLNVIKITDRQVGMEGESKIQVSFPNDKTIYTLVFGPGYLYCLDPKGKKQDYEVIWK